MVRIIVLPRYIPGHAPVDSVQIKCHVCDQCAVYKIDDFYFCHEHATCTYSQCHPQDITRRGYKIQCDQYASHALSVSHRRCDGHYKTQSYQCFK